MKNIVLGLTGQTGAGKSTLCAYLKSQGCSVIDADQVARDVVEKGSDCIAAVILEFGIEYLNMDGSLNRRKLGETVFTDKAKLKKLNDIMFPYIINSIETKIQQAKEEKDGIIILDAPTLLESGCDKFCHKVVSVIADREIRYQRIVDRDDLSEEEALHRITAQHSESFYTEQSSTVIHNDSDAAALKEQADKLLAELNALLEEKTELAEEA